MKNESYVTLPIAQKGTVSLKKHWREIFFAFIRKTVPMHGPSFKTNISL